MRRGERKVVEIGRCIDSTTPRPPHETSWWKRGGGGGGAGERNYQLLSAEVHWEKLVCIGNCGRGSVSWLVRSSAFRAEFTAHRGLRTLDAVVSETRNFAVSPRLCVGAHKHHGFVSMETDSHDKYFLFFFRKISPRTNLKRTNGNVARKDKKNLFVSLRI